VSPPPPHPWCLMRRTARSPSRKSVAISRLGYAANNNRHQHHRWEEHQARIFEPFLASSGGSRTRPSCRRTNRVIRGAHNASLELGRRFRHSRARPAARSTCRACPMAGAVLGLFVSTFARCSRHRHCGSRRSSLRKRRLVSRDVQCLALTHVMPCGHLMRFVHRCL
jgi:hypothetical protein